MADADRTKALRNVVDSLPLAPDQRRLALAGIRNATPEEGDRLLHHFDRLQRAMPAALAALDKALADKAAETAGRHSDAPGASKPKRGQKTGVRLWQAARERLDDVRIAAADRNQVRVAKDYEKRLGHGKAGLTIESQMRALVGQLIKNRHLRLSKRNIQRIHDDSGAEWRVDLYIGRVKGHDVKAYVQTPFAEGKIPTTRVYAFLTNDQLAYRSEEAERREGPLDFSNLVQAPVELLMDVVD